MRTESARAAVYVVFTAWEPVMNLRKISYPLLASVVFFGPAPNAVSAEDAPKGNKGFTASKTTVVDLAPRLKA